MIYAEYTTPYLVKSSSTGDRFFLTEIIKGSYKMIQRGDDGTHRFRYAFSSEVGTMTDILVSARERR